MNQRIKDKIEDIERYLSELYSMVPLSFKEYEQDLKSKAACERYIEKIVEAFVDLGFLAIKEKKLDMPEDDLQIFDILQNCGLLTNELSNNLQNAKRMRNVIVHEYGHIDDGIVFNALHEKLKKDVEEFIQCIKENLK
ncbi:MAG: DUF86 domain-containing protein [Nanoarchaeota archaeon]|nr:DUF86 domain-containing protein [Nanoarchaeota archaeon]